MQYKNGNQPQKLEVLVPQNQRDQLFIQGHNMKSQTRYIKQFYSEEIGLTIIDTPGAEDTQGPELDIANSIMIKEVIS